MADLNVPKDNLPRATYLHLELHMDDKISRYVETFRGVTMLGGSLGRVILCKLEHCSRKIPYHDVQCMSGGVPQLDLICRTHRG